MKRRQLQSQPKDSENEKAADFIINNGSFPDNIEFEQVSKIKIILRVKRRRAFLNKNQEELKKIDTAISICDNSDPKNFIKHKNEKNEVELRPIERRKLYIIIDKLIDGSELNAIKPAVIPKLEKALQERHKKAIKEHKYNEAKIIHENIQKLNEIKENNSLINIKPMKESQQKILKKILPTYSTNEDEEWEKSDKEAPKIRKSLYSPKQRKKPTKRFEFNINEPTPKNNKYKRDDSDSEGSFNLIPPREKTILSLETSPEPVFSITDSKNFLDSPFSTSSNDTPIKSTPPSSKKGPHVSYVRKSPEIKRIKQLKMKSKIPVPRRSSPISPRTKIVFGQLEDNYDKNSLINVDSFIKNENEVNELLNLENSSSSEDDCLREPFVENEEQETNKTKREEQNCFAEDKKETNHEEKETNNEEKEINNDKEEERFLKGEKKDKNEEEEMLNKEEDNERMLEGEHVLEDDEKMRNKTEDDELDGEEGSVRDFDTDFELKSIQNSAASSPASVQKLTEAELDVRKMIVIKKKDDDDLEDSNNSFISESYSDIVLEQGESIEPIKTVTITPIKKGENSKMKNSAISSIVVETDEEDYSDGKITAFSIPPAHSMCDNFDDDDISLSILSQKEENKSLRQEVRELRNEVRELKEIVFSLQEQINDMRDPEPMITIKPGKFLSTSDSDSYC